MRRGIGIGVPSTGHAAPCYTSVVNSGGAAREIGLPHFLLLLLTPLAPPFLSGVLRAGLGEAFLPKRLASDLPLSTGLAIGGLVTLVVLVWALAGVRLRRPRHWMIIGSAGLLVIGTVLTWYCLYNRWFDGLVTVGGGDVGQHLENRRFFLAWTPRSANGAVTFYAVTYWFERILALDAFASFRLGFYGTVATMVLVIAAVATYTGREAEPRSWAWLWLLFAVAVQMVLFPLLHYLQADGFYSQLFVLVPLFTCWAAYGLAERPAARIVILVVWVVATRYTYGLNLGDTLVTAAALMAFETSSLPAGVRKTPHRLLAFFFLAVALPVYWIVIARWDEPGKVVHPFLLPLLLGEASLALMLGVLPRLSQRAGYATGPGEQRLLRFACLLGCSNVILPLVHALSGGSSHYFFVKYSFTVVPLLVAAAVVTVPFTLPGIVRHALRGPPRSIRRASLVGGAIPLALLLLAGAYQPYLKTYLERGRSGPPWHRISALADREGIHRIAEVLRTEKQPFAGLIASSWPWMHFVNGAFEMSALAITANWESLAEEASQARPGCLFWYSGPEESSRLAHRPEPGAKHLLRRLCQLESLPEKRCQSYAARWDPARQLTLCHWCDPAGRPPPPVPNGVAKGTSSNPCSGPAGQP